MNKKAQAQQVFTYLFILIVIGAVVLFGYKAINNMRLKADDVAYLTFETDLKSEIDKISRSYGDVTQKSFKVPSGYEEVCFVDLDTVALSEDDKATYPIIDNAVGGDEKANENVFLVKNIADKSFYGGKITVADGFDCIQITRGQLRLRLEGVANGKAQISEQAS